MQSPSLLISPKAPPTHRTAFDGTVLLGVAVEPGPKVVGEKVLRHSGLHVCHLRIPVPHTSVARELGRVYHIVEEGMRGEGGGGAGRGKGRGEEGRGKRYTKTQRNEFDC